MAIQNKIEGNSKEIIALDQLEAIRLRPGMYIGSVSMNSEKLPIIENDKLILKEKLVSPGFNHLIVEIFENAIDEAKRMKGKMKNIYFTVNLDTNKVTIKDEGGGFYKAHTKHIKTKKNIVRTAMEDLHAGSNFKDSSTYLIGTHGVGAAVVNMLSSDFSIVTVNKTHSVSYDWKDFKIKKEEIRIKNAKDIIGTTISFIPTPEVFKDYKWDIELIKTYLSFKSFLLGLDPLFKNLQLYGDFISNGVSQKIGITKDFLPKETIFVKNRLGTVILWKSFENSTSISFVNGSQCTGIQQKIINDWGNEYFNFQAAHHFYNTLIALDVPSTLMRFGDQNKSKYDVTRYEIEDLLIDNFKSKFLRDLKSSNISKEILESIEDRLFEENMKKIKKAQKNSIRKISDKYSAATKNKTYLFLTEGISASGSIKQARNSQTEGVYALKGKIKNAKRLGDLAENKEILELMSILSIEPHKLNIPKYTNIVIATDQDCDGEHITSLIINFFYKWFPYIIENGNLLKLVTPLIVGTYNNERKYFYNFEEYNKFIETKKLSNINYLKGLGSLNIEDWTWVMDNKVFFSIVADKSAGKQLEMAFGDNANSRKLWLQNN